MCVSPNMLAHRLAWLWPVSLHEHGLNRSHHSHSITACKIPQSESLTSSAYSLDYGLLVPTRMAFKCISPHSMDHSHPVNLQTLSVTAPKLIPKLPLLWHTCCSDHSLQVYVHTPAITISVSTTRFTRIQRLCVPQIIPDKHLQVHFQPHLITAMECKAVLTPLSFPVAPWIALIHRQVATATNSHVDGYSCSYMDLNAN